jgi:recombination associated protein RdgC
MAVEGKILERLGMAEEAVRTIDELFRMFLKIRISAEWSDELAKLKAWVHRSVGN